MSDAAQGEPSQHEVFRTPFKVQPKLEKWPTPDQQREYPGGKDLPDQLTVWRVQNSGKDYGSVVSMGYGFGDSPDAEILTVGYAPGKPPGSAGVSRHGNFLQWGFSSPPAQMTDAGKAFFLNCIVYVHKFDGKRPLIHVQSSDRTYAVYLIGIMDRFNDPQFGARIVGSDLAKQYADKAKDLAALYLQQIELVYCDGQGQFIIDKQLQDLGITSNRKVEMLDKLVNLLGQPPYADAAQQALQRYTGLSLNTPQRWQQWLTANRPRLFFSDVGGYKFFVIPEGYLVAPSFR
ncbi:MAG: hypothetical protein ABSB42_08600 [Tepidisphaeraceae bacterium]|jgi:hypothetical protein